MPQTPHTPEAGEVLTTAEAAAFLGIKPESLRNLRRAGRIDFLRYGDKTIRYERAALAAYKAASTVKAEQPTPDPLGRVRVGSAA